MCGILGQSNRERPIDGERFARMLSTLNHRGPDGRGIRLFHDARVALGHTRLSIIDLSDAGAQPMCNEDGSVWLICNGEIYNYRELRLELLRLGHTFKSRSDSEVIIHAYEEWGTACVARLRGMFAFGIYDCGNRTLLLARDHVGIKPLYYYAGPDTFLFASQPRALLEAEGLARTLDPAAFSLFLAYGNVPAEHCIYAGVKKLLPGHWLMVKDGHVEMRQYWTANYKPVIRDAAEAQQAVRGRIEECVLAQSVSDVPVGTLLSGGVDSTIVTFVLSSRMGRDLTTFTIGFDEPESDERPYARLVADEYRTRHRERCLDYDAACALLPAIADAFDEPFDVNSLFPYLALSRFVNAEGLKVVFGGDGGDELFAGYLWYDRVTGIFESHGGIPLLSRVLPWLVPFPKDRPVSPVDAFFRINGYLGPKDQDGIRGPMVPGMDSSAVLKPLQRHWRPDLPPVLAAQLLDFNCFLVDHCLAKVDRASMASGVEVRVPFLDVELVELVFSIDHGIVFHSGERKALLIRAMQHALPDKLVAGRKKGFSSPLRPWLERGLAAAGRGLLIKGGLCAGGYLDAGAIETNYARLSHRNQLLLLSAELWFRRWFEGRTDPVELSAYCGPHDPQEVPGIRKAVSGSPFR